jgi:hypothetical protein
MPVSRRRTGESREPANNRTPALAGVTISEGYHTPILFLAVSMVNYYLNIMI